MRLFVEGSTNKRARDIIELALFATGTILPISILILYRKSFWRDYPDNLKLAISLLCSLLNLTITATIVVTTVILNGLSIFDLSLYSNPFIPVLAMNAGLNLAILESSLVALVYQDR